MTNAIDSLPITLQQGSFKESSSFAGTDWDDWVDGAYVRKHKAYGSVAAWSFTCFEDANAVDWDDSVANHLKGHVASGVPVALEISNGTKHSLPLDQTVYVEAVEVSYSADMKVRYFSLKVRGCASSEFIEGEGEATQSIKDYIDSVIEGYMLTVADFGDMLRENLDIHSAFTWEKFLREGLDAHMNGRKDHVSTGVEVALPSSFWTISSLLPPYTGAITLPAGYKVCAAYSKRAFQNPVLSAKMHMPDWTGVGDTENSDRLFFFGFENGSEGANGIASFRFQRTTAGGNKLWAAVGGSFVSSFPCIDVTALLPADYLTVEYRYTVKVTRTAALFYCGTALLAVVLFTPGFSYNEGETVATAPYGVACCSVPVSQVMTSLMELYSSAQLATTLVMPLSPFYFRVSDGDPELPLDMPLYEEETDDLFAGYALASGSLTSQPIPAFGHANKTFQFKADENGTLDIEILTAAGNWLIYDDDGSGHTESAYVAGSLWTYIMTGDAVLVRLKYTPGSYTATISDAEVALK